MRPSATRTRDVGAGGDAGDRGDDVAVGVLEHGVAALQGGQRGQGPGAGALVAEVVGGPVEARGRSAAAGAVAQLVDLVGAGVDEDARVGERRPGPQRVEPGLLAGQPAARRRARIRSRARSTPAQLLGDVGDDAAWRRRSGVEARTSATRSSSGWSGSWPIAETTGVRHRVHGADQRLVGERQQVLDRAAAAGDDDHVDVGVAVEPARPPRSPRRRRAWPCIAAYATSKRDRRPAAAGVLEHVALGGASWAR